VGIIGIIRMNGEVPEGLVLDSTALGGLSPYPLPLGRVWAKGKEKGGRDTMG